MALTRITKGVIKPNENYDTHNINSTGIVTAIGLDVNGNGDISGNLSVGGVLTYEDVTSIDSVGIITAQKDIHVGAGVSAVGVGTFSSLDIGGDIDVDGHTNLDNVSVAGVSTFAGTVKLSAINSTASALTIHNTADRVLIKGSNRIDLADDQVRFQNRAQNASLLDATSSYVKLYQSGNEKLATTSTGVNVTGNTVADGLVIDGNSDLNGDLDVDGHTNLDNVSISGVTTSGHLTINGDLTINDNYPSIYLNDTDSNNDFMLQNQNGIFTVYDVQNNADRFEILSDGTVRSPHYTLQSQSPSLTFNDTNHDSDYMWQNANGLFKIFDNTNGADRFAVNSSGSVFVYGDELYIGDSIIHHGDTNTKIRFPAADTISFDTSGHDRIYIKSNGNIGIGTDNPSAKIEIAPKNDGAPYLRVKNHTSAGAYTGNYGSEFRHVYNSTNHAMLIHTQEAADARRVLDISDSNGIFATFTNGKVGIGTVIPASKLDVRFPLYA